MLYNILNTIISIDSNYTVIQKPYKINIDKLGRVDVTKHARLMFDIALEMAHKHIEITREALSSVFLCSERVKQRPELSALQTLEETCHARAALIPAPSLNIADFVVSAMIVRGVLLVRAEPLDEMNDEDDDTMEDDIRFRNKLFWCRVMQRVRHTLGCSRV